VLTSIEGVEFDEAWAARTITRVGGVDTPVIGRAELIRNKKATGRAKDLADAAWLEGREV